MVLEKILWLFNFSASFTGGGLIRLIETARWFDQNEGGNFIKKTFFLQYPLKN